MAAINFPASPALNQLFVAPNGVTYKWTGMLWLAQAGTVGVYVGTAPPTTPFVGQMWWCSDGSVGGGVLYIYYDDGNSQQWVPISPAPSQSGNATPPTYDVYNGWTSENTGYNGGTDTVMQITQGTPIPGFSRSFTAFDPTRPIEVDISGVFSAGSAGVNITVGLFVDGGAPAVAQKTINSAASTPLDMRLYWQSVLAAGAHTFTVRFASSSTGTAAFVNGSNANRWGGGAMRTTMKISEVH
jgi:hypothetical protein